MESSGLIDLKFKNRRDYSKYYLIRNPFPAIGVPEDVPLFTADRKMEIKRFQNVISELLDTERSQLTVMVGEYGGGKSHLFKVFKQSVNNQLLNRENGTLGVYIKSPGEEFNYFFQGLIDDIGREILVKLSIELITEFIISSESIDIKIKDKLSNNELKYEDLIKDHFIYKDTFFKMRKSLFGDIQESDVVKAFLYLSHPEKRLSSWKWFIGESLDKKEKEGMDLVSSSTTVDNSYHFFCDFIKLLHIIGIKNIVLLIDELEKITLLSSVKRARYQDTLRQLIDDHPKNICFYFAIAQKQWSDLAKEPTALVRRLQGNWHILEPFKKEDIKELIENYLHSTRIINFSGNTAKKEFPKCEPSLCPFTDSAIIAINKYSKGTVSNILLICRTTLDIIVDNPNEYTCIDSDLIEKTFS